MGCEKLEAKLSPISKKGKHHGKMVPMEKGKELTSIEARCTDDSHVAPKQWPGQQETYRTHKKVEDFYFYVNLGDLT